LKDSRVRGYFGYYDTIDQFFYADILDSHFRTDFMLKSISQYRLTRKKFPNSIQGVYEKYSGCDLPKLGVFSKLNLVNNDYILAKLFSRQDFTGDMLFSTDIDIKNKFASIPVNLIQKQEPLNFTNHLERIEADIEVDKFSFNMLKLKVNVIGPPNQSCLLYYADAYHPDWNVYVNGHKVTLIKANIGYKAVVIPYGLSEVVFKFGNKFYDISIFATLILSFLILCAAGYFFISELLLPLNQRKDKCPTNTLVL
jgi:hypothetical protein